MSIQNVQRDSRPNLALDQSKQTFASAVSKVGDPQVLSDPAKTLFYELVTDKKKQDDYLKRGEDSYESYRLLKDKSFWESSPSKYIFALLYYYTKEGFDINKELNKSPIDAKYQRLKTILNDYIQTTDWKYDKNWPPKEGSDFTKLYRGAESYDPELYTLEVGGKFEMKHFVSTSKDIHVAHHFAGETPDWKGKGYVFVIENPEHNALLYQGISEYSNECEVLLPSGSEFEVTQIVWKQDVKYSKNLRNFALDKTFDRIAYVHVKKVN